LVGVYFFLPQLGSFRNTFTVIRHSSWFWLAVGLVASFLSFIAGAVTQFAAGNLAGYFPDVVVLQFAGSFVNHFLPFSVGGINLTARYYKKLGKHQAQAITMASIPTVFGVITTVIIIAIVSPVTLIHLSDRLHPSHFSSWWLAPISAGILICALLIFKYRQRAKKVITEAWAGVKGIGGKQQLALLVAGSAAITLLAASALFASILAIHASVALVGVFIIYVTSSLVSNIVPTPGGIGATEAVLVLALVASRLSLPQAAAVTLIYRFLTFWLPIIPGGLALHRLNRQKTLS
jgi:uncharacterized membrane protein YbhN (UPF0104 family)